MSVTSLPLIFCIAALSAQTVKPAGVSNYAHDVRPILQARCVVCHNESTTVNPTLSGGLALDSYASLQKGVVSAEGGRPIYMVGKSSESELIRRVTADSPKMRMPRGGAPLTAAQIQVLKKWIDTGAHAGDLSAARSPERSDPTARPMPRNRGDRDVVVATLIEPTPDLLAKGEPKDSRLGLALKVGPIPAVTSITYSHDGKWLAAGGFRSIMLWDVTSARPVAWTTHLLGQVQSLSISRDNTFIAAAGGAPGQAGEVQIFVTQTLDRIGKLDGHTDVVNCVAWSSDGKQIVTASHDKTARVWEWPSGKELVKFSDHSDNVTGACFSPDDRSVYTGSYDHNVRQFDVATGKLTRVFGGCADPIMTVAVSPDGKNLISSGAEARIRWWNLENGETARFSDGSGGQVNHIVFSADGSIAASASADKTLRIWNTSSGDQQGALEGSADWLYAVAVSPNAKFAAAACGDGIIRVWEIASGRLRLSLLSWSVSAKYPEWAAITPEGYFDASPEWAASLRAVVGSRYVESPRVVEFVRNLRYQHKVRASCEGGELEPAKLVAPEEPKKVSNE